MIHTLHPYPTSKPSGIPWLGGVPEHWAVERLSTSVESQINGVWGSDPDGTDDLPCIRVADFDRRNRRIRTDKLTLRSVKPSERSGRILRKGDLLLEKSGGGERQPVGTVILYDHDFQAVCSNFVGRMVLREGYDPTYQTYLHATLYAIGVNKRSIKQTTGIQNIDASSYLSELVGVPPLAEQAAIVRYLDYVDRRIRRYVSAKQKLIALLEEEKQAIVNRAVTRGLDPNVRLKPSGVEWLGDVPEHWEVRRGKRLFSPRRELARPEDIQLSATQAYGVIPQDEYEERIGRRIVKISLHLNQRRHVEVDDFVISMRSFQGGLERAWATGCIRSSYIVLRPTIEVDVEFFSYVLKSQAYIQALRSTANFIRDGQDLTFNNFCAVDLPFPAAEEQRRIAVAIGEATANIDATIARARRQIELLQEYRTRLIADVVTGKLDVREAAAQLPDEPDDEEPIDEGRALADDADGDLYDAGNFKEQLAMESEVRA